TLTKSLQAVTVKDEFSQILTGNGAAGLNASTSTDLTSYVVALPSNRLELWCLMESARLRDPVLREFYSERDVVMEERRMRIDNQPQGKLYEQLLLAAFQAHPYRVPTVGWMSDLEHLTRPQAAEFRRGFYAPNNAVAALVGDLDPAAAERLIRRYFGDLPAGPPPRAPHGPEEVETAILRELQRLAAEPVPDRELQKVKNQLQASFLYPLRSNPGLAAQLSYYEILTGDWKNLNAYASALQTTT